MSIRVPSCNQIINLVFPCNGVISPASLRKLLGFAEQSERTWFINQNSGQRGQKTLKYFNDFLVILSVG